MKIKYLLISLVVLLSGCRKYEIICGLNENDITNMYSTYVEEWKKDCKESFDLAEKTVLKPVVPKPNDGTNPDPAKCICNGTGIIVQGDGHKTVCPFHGKPSNKR